MARGRSYLGCDDAAEAHVVMPLSKENLTDHETGSHRSAQITTGVVRMKVTKLLPADGFTIPFPPDSSSVLKGPEAGDARTDESSVRQFR